MIIGIDATGLYGHRTGIENYIINIIKGLLKVDHKNEYVIYCRDVIPDEFQVKQEKVVFKLCTLKIRKIFQQMRLPKMVHSDHIDLMFYPGNAISLYCPCKSVLTIHDIFPFVTANDVPRYHKNRILSFVNMFYWKWMTKAGCRQTDKIIAVSRATKDDLITVFSSDPEKIDVIYEAASDQYQSTEDDHLIQEFRKTSGLEEGYILCVGTGSYKNLQGSIRAFLSFKKTQKSNLKLLIIGPKERIKPEVFELVRASNFKSDIILWGYFPVTDLPLLYHAAELLLFPSFYEGFGLPVLEAFSCGTPVITSNIASLPEIAGDAAVLVDPYHTEEIAFQLERVMNDKTLRDRMISKGFNHVQQFTWENAAKKTLETMERVHQSA